MDVDKDTENQIQELQFLEQKVQAFLMQKQAFEMELNEVENALKEIVSSSEEEIYKITGQIMAKAKKSEIQKDLSEKKNLLSARIKSIEGQEGLLSKRAEELREKVLVKLKK